MHPYVTTFVPFPSNVSASHTHKESSEVNQGHGQSQCYPHRRADTSSVLDHLLHWCCEGRLCTLFVLSSTHNLVCSFWIINFSVYSGCSAALCSVCYNSSVIWNHVCIVLGVASGSVRIWIVMSESGSWTIRSPNESGSCRRHWNRSLLVRSTDSSAL